MSVLPFDRLQQQSFHYVGGSTTQSCRELSTFKVPQLDSQCILEITSMCLLIVTDYHAFIRRHSAV